MRSDIGNMLAWKLDDLEGIDTVDGEITKFPGDTPSDADLETWFTEYDAYLVSIAHKQKRKESFDNELFIGDQLDEILKFINSQPVKSVEMQAVIDKSKEIKDRFPKEN